MNIDAIISTCQALAAQQYPQDDSERWKYLSELLATKLREIAYTSQNLHGKVETGNSSVAGGPMYYYESPLSTKECLDLSNLFLKQSMN